MSTAEGGEGREQAHAEKTMGNREKGIMIEIENLRVVDGWRWRFR